MPSFRPVTIVLLAALTLASCRRDLKKQYLESGDKEFDRSRYQQAAIQYENAKKTDPHYGLTYYKLGLVYLKVTPANVKNSVDAFRRAVELLKDSQAYHEEYRQSLVRLSELYLFFAYKDQEIMEDVEGYCDVLLKMDPNSFDGYRLSGDLNFVRAKQAAAGIDQSAADKFLAAAMQKYRKADSIKPGQAAIAMQIAQVLEGQKRYAEAEPFYRRAIDQDKRSYMGYVSLYHLYMRDRKTPEAEQLLQEAARNMPEGAEEWKSLRTSH
jgi:tetratricopeptide (TPR) repeat protein